MSSNSVDSETQAGFSLNSNTTRRTGSRQTSLRDLRALMVEEAFKDVDNESIHVSPASPFTKMNNQSDPSSPRQSLPSSPPAVSRGNSFKKIPRMASLGRQYSDRLKRLAAAGGEVPEIKTKPVKPLPPNITAYLEKMCARGVEFLEKLQKPAYSRTSDSTAPIMPKTALRFSRGLAFMWQWKAGLGVGYTSGSGFVISRLGPGLWSAPLFLCDRFVTLGLTAGFRTVDAAYAIPSDYGMECFTADKLSGVLDLGLTLGVDPWEAEVPVKAMQGADRSTPPSPYAKKDTDFPKVYQLCDGVILDCSWRCGFNMVDDAVNEALWGAGVTHSEILGGGVDIPGEFKTLYDTIAQFAESANMTKTTQSQFLVEKQRVQLAATKATSSFKMTRLLSRQKSDASSNGGTPITLNPSFDDSLPLNHNSGSSVPSNDGTVGTSAGGSDGSFLLFGDTELLPLDLDDPGDDKQQQHLETISEVQTGEVAPIVVAEAVAVN